MHYPLHILIKMRKAHFNDAQLYFSTGCYIYLCYVILYAHIRSESVRSVWMVYALWHFSISTRSHHSYSYALYSNHKANSGRLL